MMHNSSACFPLEVGANTYFQLRKLTYAKVQIYPGIYMYSLLFFAPFRMSLFLTYVLGKTSPIPMGLFLDKASGCYNPLQALASSIFCNILFSGTKLALQRD